MHGKAGVGARRARVYEGGGRAGTRAETTNANDGPAGGFFHSCPSTSREAKIRAAQEKTGRGSQVQDHKCRRSMGGGRPGSRKMLVVHLCRSENSSLEADTGSMQAQTVCGAEESGHGHTMQMLPRSRDKAREQGGRASDATLVTAWPGWPACRSAVLICCGVVLGRAGRRGIYRHETIDRQAGRLAMRLRSRGKRFVVRAVLTSDKGRRMERRLRRMPWFGVGVCVSLVASQSFLSCALVCTPSVLGMLFHRRCNPVGVEKEQKQGRT